MVWSACGSGESAPPAPESAPAEPAPPPSVAESAPAPTPPATDEAAEATGDARAPADACARAQSCCPAYVAALPASGRGEAGEACVSLALAVELEGQARDEACQGALEGFRSSLRATGLDVPEACR
ncbi:hypothetical protein DB32_005581 [Sandaracinus amylolyticus]|uniref:Uncharacterized protein n=1 Tax=Sandaracinus amylolyticus TaxID=927083 RepID=A0A0F6YKR0_9BACT|nr:hypothetical protein DB32_005581 [Sandaracinus amylolyticus]